MLAAIIGLGVTSDVALSDNISSGFFSCERLSYENQEYTVCRVNAERADIRLFLRDDNGEIIGQFSKLERFLLSQGKELLFAMNGGMYHADRSPVGHYVENGREFMRVIDQAGPGNFGLLPNGIFCVGDGVAHVHETNAFLRSNPNCTYATQSGPMLVIDGQLHPRFLRNSNSRYIRNGVGTSENGKEAVFVISEAPVTFWEFGQFFREGLGLTQALYLDGSISRIYAPVLRRADIGFNMGPIIGIVENYWDG